MIWLSNRSRWIINANQITVDSMNTKFVAMIPVVPGAMAIKQSLLYEA